MKQRQRRKKPQVGQKTKPLAPKEAKASELAQVHPKVSVLDNREMPMWYFYRKEPNQGKRKTSH